jgi:hypothetical protein
MAKPTTQKLQGDSVDRMEWTKERATVANKVKYHRRSDSVGVFGISIALNR